MSPHIRQAVVAWRTVISHLQNEHLGQIKYGHAAAAKNSSVRGASSTRGRRGGSKGRGRIQSPASRGTETEGDGAAETELITASVMSALSDFENTTEQLCHRHLRQAGDPTYTNVACARKIDKVDQTGDKTQVAVKMMKACPGVHSNSAGKHSYQNDVSKVPKTIMDDFMQNSCQRCGTCIAIINGLGFWIGHRKSSYADTIDQCLSNENLKESKKTKRRDLFKNWADAIKQNKVQKIQQAGVDLL